jgi:hypothetical protein
MPKKLFGISNSQVLAGSFNRPSTGTSIPFNFTWGTPPTGPSNPNASFSITLRKAPADLIAPCGVWLRAANFVGFKDYDNNTLVEPAGDDNVYDRTQHDITYIWDFPDEGYVPMVTPNIPTSWRNRLRGYGKQVAHVFTSPGTKVVNCAAFDTKGNYAFATFTFGVGGNAGPILDPDTFYAGDLTICVVSNGAVSTVGAPAGATIVTGPENFGAVLNARWTAGKRNLRVLMRAGDEIVDSNFIGAPLSNGTGRSNCKGMFIGRFGTGANLIEQTHDN